MQLTKPKMCQIKCCVLVCLLFFSSIVYPISQNVARLCSVLSGALMASPTLLLLQESKSFVLLTAPLFGVGFFLGKTIFDRFTPVNRIKNAEYELNGIASNVLVCQQWIYKRELLDAIENIYLEDQWPLVCAFNDLVSCKERLSWACDSADKAAREDRLFVERAALVNKQANIFFSNISVVLKIIKSTPKYMEQLGQFEKYQRQQEEMRIKWEQAQAQQKIAEAHMISAKAREEAVIAQKQSQKEAARQAAAQLEEERRRQEEMRIKYQQKLAQQKIAEAEMKIKLEKLQAQQKMMEADITSAKAREEAALIQKQKQREIAQQVAHLEEERRHQEEMRIKYQERLAQQKIAEAEVKIKLERLQAQQKIAQSQVISANVQKEPKIAQQTAVVTVENQQKDTEERRYESESCCVCLEDFKKPNVEGVERIILRSCGHDICKECAQRLFFGPTKAKICPTCRTNVDLSRLQASLNKRH